MTDIIVSAFATPPESLYRSLAQDLTLFTRPPLVLDVPPKMEPGEVLASPGFARVASEYQRRDPGGSILRPLFKERLSGVTVETVTLIGFSAGNTLLTEILKGPDAQGIDAVITLDGMVGQKLAMTTPVLQTESAGGGILAEDYQGGGVEINKVKVADDIIATSAKKK